MDEMQLMKFRSFLAVLVTCFGFSHGSVLAAEQSLADKLRAIPESYIKNYSSPGLSVIVVKSGAILLSDGFGTANIETETAATKKTVYKVGSITKQFTAAAIMKLISENKLALDDAVTRHLKGAPEAWKGVTIRNLLNHTSGIPSYTSIDAFSKVYRLDLSHDQVLEIIKAEPAAPKPGRSWDYSNSNYYILGMVIESVSNQSYEDYLAATFFRPLDMSATVYCGNTKIIKHRASGYERTAEGWINAEIFSMNPPFSAGALCSTAEDLAKWSEALLGGKVISSENYRKMITPGNLADGTTLTYGFGLMMDELSGAKRVAHNGGIPGFSAYMSRYDEHDLHVIVLTNAGEGTPDKLEAELAQAVLDWKGL